jgi:hypothetical protein
MIYYPLIVMPGCCPGCGCAPHQGYCPTPLVPYAYTLWIIGPFLEDWMWQWMWRHNVRQDAAGGKVLSYRVEQLAPPVATPKRTRKAKVAKTDKREGEGAVE